MTEEQSKELAEYKLAIQMLCGATLKTLDHLLSDKCGEAKSGWLDDSDIHFVETLTGSKVNVSCESGEYFYKLV